MSTLKKKELSPLRFSDHFKLGKTQAQLDFVDIPLERDIHLFLDPYAIYVGKTEWLKEANNLMVDYFDHLLESIQTGNQLEAIRLLANLHEPNDARLGFCTDQPKGRGIGVKQAKELYDRFRKSKAIETGSLKDLLDCELMIPGISSDKISDMTINILRSLLIEYTQQQCVLWDIPMEEVEAGVAWDPEIHAWCNSYSKLPVFNGKGLLLVPKIAVRRRLEANSEDYFNKAVIPFLKAEEISANSGLVRLIKGEKRVLKKDIEAKHFNKGVHIKDALQDFTTQHPEVLADYKRKRVEQLRPLSDYELEEAQETTARDLHIRSSVDALSTIKPGNADAHKYHDIVIGLLTTIFGGSLSNPKKEQPINNGRKKIDITYNNAARKGFFFNLHEKHQIKSPYVFVECKNYGSDPENKELDQLIGRFTDQRGRFGIMVCREIKDEALAIQRSRDAMLGNQGYIIYLTDEDLKNLSVSAAKQDHEAISSYMQRKLDKLILG